MSTPRLLAIASVAALAAVGLTSCTCAPSEAPTRREREHRSGRRFIRPWPIWPAEWDRERNRIPVGGPPRIWWREAFEKRLAEPVSFDFIETPLDKEWKPVETAMNRPISFDFKGVSFDDFIAFLRARTKLKISRAAAARPSKIDRIALEVKDMKVKIALAWACHQLDLAYTVRDGAVFISTPDRIAAMQKGKVNPPGK